MEIDDLNILKYLVDYAIIKNDPKICKEIDSKVFLWCLEFEDFEFRENLVSLIEKSNTNKSLWKNLLDTDFVIETFLPSHTDFYQMIEDIKLYDRTYQYKKYTMLFADDNKRMTKGYVFFYIVDGKEMTTLFDITLSDIMKTKGDDKKRFMQCQEYLKNLSESHKEIVS